MNDADYLNTRKSTKLKSDRYRIQTQIPELIKQILNIPLQNNLNIVSLQSEHEAFEEVFRSLTQKADGPAERTV